MNVLEPEVLEYSFSLQMKVSLLYQLFDLCVQANEGNFFLESRQDVVVLLSVVAFRSAFDHRD